MFLHDTYKRPSAYEDVYQWHLGMVPETVERNGKILNNPARKNAIFIVHGMGQQDWAETAASLRSGFEDVLEEINDENQDAVAPASMTSPFIHEGFWANYDDLAATFQEEVKRLDDTKLKFFSLMWKKRSVSSVRTLQWLFTQQLKLINPAVIWRIHFFAWLLYIPLQIVSCFSLTVLWILKRKVVASVLGDVRLYIDPQGVIERAIVQRIDKRVGESFLRMIGLNWEFKPLKVEEMIHCDGRPVVFDRIIWVAHSLGSVVSYNVLSDIFHKADALEKSNESTKEQKTGVQKVRNSLRRFVTLGSPLDKIAFLTGREALRPWPQRDRVDLVKPSSEAREEGTGLRDFWVNFYQVFDPVSGALQNPLICGEKPPLNFHISLFKFPGVAHLSYWKDSYTLKYILSRLYGKEFLPVERQQNLSPGTLTFLALLGYTVWGAIIAGMIVFIFCVVWPIILLCASWFWEAFSNACIWR